MDVELTELWSGRVYFALPCSALRSKCAHADAGTITKSSSLKSIVSKLFGGSTSSNSIITASSSSGSLSSVSGGNTTLTQASSTSSATLRSQSSSSGNARLPKSSAESAVDPVGPVPVPREGDQASLAAAPAASPKPAYRIIDETSFLTSIADSTSANAYARPSIEVDASFAPRSSFDDDSLALANVPCWPPRSPGAPGVVIISPRQSPPKAHGAAHPPPSAGGKRRFDDDDDDASECDGQGDGDGDDKLDDYFHAIRMLPQRGPTPASPAHGENSLYLSPSGPSASGRKIARVPKRYSLIAGSPPKFDKDAPALPSLAGMMLASLASDQEAGAVKSANEADKQASLSSVSAAMDTSPARVSAPAFTFGSSIQQSRVFSPPPPAKIEAAPATGQGDFLAKQFEEMQRRLGSTSSSSTNLTGMLKIAEGGQGVSAAALGSGESLFAGLMGKRATTGVRFEGHHDKEFQKWVQSAAAIYLCERYSKSHYRMDSIANHYAAKRNGPAFVPSKRTKTDVPAMPSRQDSSSCVSTLPTNLNQQGRAAPMIPPRPELGGPKIAKNAAQQQEERRRVLDYSSGNGPLQRDGKVKNIRRKGTAVGTGTTPRRARMADPGQRELLPAGMSQRSGARSTGLKTSVCDRTPATQSRESRAASSRHSHEAQACAICLIQLAVRQGHFGHRRLVELADGLPQDQHGISALLCVERVAVVQVWLGLRLGCRAPAFRARQAEHGVWEEEQSRSGGRTESWSGPGPLSLDGQPGQRSCERSEATFCRQWA